MESRAYTGWELLEAARAQKRVQDFHRKLRNWNQWESEARREKNSALGGNGAAPSPVPLLSPRYYHTLFTHSLPKALRTLADESPPCVDVLMNFLVAAVTKLPPIKVPYGPWHQETKPPLVRTHGRGRHWEGPG